MDRPWYKISVATLALLISLSMATVSGGSDHVFHVVRVTGTLVHLRVGIPAVLDHAGVLRHLSPNELFVVEKKSVGISHTGKGTGGWLFVRNVTDANEFGWVSDRWVIPVGLPSESSIEATAPATTPVAADRPATPLQHSCGGDNDAVSRLLSMFANAATILQFMALLCGWIGLTQLLYMLFGGGQSKNDPSDPPAPPPLSSHQQSFVYRNGFAVPTMTS